LQGAAQAGLEITDASRMLGLGDWPGDQRGPSTGLLSLLLGIAHTHWTGSPTLVTTLTDPTEVACAAVSCPQPARPAHDPELRRAWPRATGLQTTYMPWIADAAPPA
jgi:hypothetical protein